MADTKTKLVSPLAPVDGFPELPVIDGVRFSSCAAGIKYPGRHDVMVAEVCAGSALAGVFTKSTTRAASVLDCQAKMGKASDKPAVILVNSGNANAFTGAVGQQSVDAICEKVAAVFGTTPDRVFTASTGVIGERLPHEKIIKCVDDMHGTLTANGAEMAARAIMTTDTFPKGAVESFATDGGKITIAGFAKGSGMIAPDMATMLVYIFTDAKIDQGLLQNAVSELAEKTFNSITVDSDTSTSDALIIAATGRTNAAEIKDAASQGFADFRAALHKVMLNLAHQVVRDGEGATKFVAVKVTGADSDADAKRVAMAIANSPLVKTAIAGEDPNWGRVVMAVGKSGAKADRDKLAIRFGDILVAENGWVAESYSENAGATYMRQQDLEISVDMGLGHGASTVWTCDFTKRYIEINADYRS